MRMKTVHGCSLVVRDSGHGPLYPVTHLQKRVLELDVAVHDAHLVAVVQPNDELLEEPPVQGRGGRG